MLAKMGGEKNIAWLINSQRCAFCFGELTSSINPSFSLCSRIGCYFILKAFLQGEGMCCKHVRTQIISWPWSPPILFLPFCPGERGVISFLSATKAQYESRQSKCQRSPLALLLSLKLKLNAGMIADFFRDYF